MVKGASSQRQVRFSPAEIERYARHIALREIGGPGQKLLKQARVLVIGAGGLGSPALLYLAAGGVGRIGIVDDDEVALSNLQRQIVHRNAWQGMAKTESARKALAELNPEVKVITHNVRLNAGNVAELVGSYDLILDGCDNFETRYVVNLGCVRAGKPLVSGAIGQWEGQLSVFDPASGYPCYQCIFPEPPARGLVPTCAEAGVIGALPGVVGSLMALEAIKLITDVGESLKGKMLIYDSLWSAFHTITVSRSEKCPACLPSVS